MMTYLCLGYYDPSRYASLSEAEQAAIAPQCRPHDERLYATGAVRLVASLAEGGTVTLKPSQGRTQVLDGPYAEAKEVVGSFFLIEAESREEAVRIASLHPAAKWGEHLGFAIEVRAIDYMREFEPPA